MQHAKTHAGQVATQEFRQFIIEDMHIPQIYDVSDIIVRTAGTTPSMRLSFAEM